MAFQIGQPAKRATCQQKVLREQHVNATCKRKQVFDILINTKIINQTCNLFFERKFLLSGPSLQKLEYIAEKVVIVSDTECRMLLRAPHRDRLTVVDTGRNDVRPYRKPGRRMPNTVRYDTETNRNYPSVNGLRPVFTTPHPGPYLT